MENVKNFEEFMNENDVWVNGFGHDNKKTRTFVLYDGVKGEVIEVEIEPGFTEGSRYKIKWNGGSEEWISKEMFKEIKI